MPETAELYWCQYGGGLHAGPSIDLSIHCDLFKICIPKDARRTEMQGAQGQKAPQILWHIAGAAQSLGLTYQALMRSVSETVLAN